jgi:hypothetical protein
MTKFVREERYIVFKLKDLTEDEILNLYSYNHAMVEGVVVESDWPEYEIVWKMIEDRVKKEKE